MCAYYSTSLLTTTKIVTSTTVINSRVKKITIYGTRFAKGVQFLKKSIRAGKKIISQRTAKAKRFFRLTHFLAKQFVTFTIIVLFLVHDDGKTINNSKENIATKFPVNCSPETVEVWWEGGRSAKWHHTAGK